MPASWVDITGANGSMEGYLTRPEEDGNYPAVLVIQEIWGVNSHIEPLSSAKIIPLHLGAPEET